LIKVVQIHLKISDNHINPIYLKISDHDNQKLKKNSSHQIITQSRLKINDHHSNPKSFENKQSSHHINIIQLVI